MALTPAQERAVTRAEEQLRKRRLFSAHRICHVHQYAAAADRARNVTIAAGRQSGKTFGAATVDLEDAVKNLRDLVLVYVSTTQPRVKKMYWKPLKKLIRDYGWTKSVRINNTELSIEVPATGVTIYAMAANDERTIDRIRGIPRLYRVRVDEAQDYESDSLQYLLDAVRPGLRPMKGCIVLMGTGSAPVGTWYEATSNEEYSHHHFTYRDNDKLGQTQEEAEAIVEEDLRAAKRTRDSAWFRREYLAEFVHEIAERVYKFLESRNTYTDLPDDLDTFLICGDTGVKDADALLLIGWCSSGPRKVYLLLEHVARGQDVDDLDRVLTEWLTTYSPIAVVLDAGANAKAVLTIQRRHLNVPIAPAEKPPVNQQVDELNAFLTDAVWLCRADSQFAREIVLPTWKDGLVHGKLVEHGHSDVIPAARYGAIAMRPLLPDAVSLPKDAETERKAAILERVRKAQRKQRRLKWQEATRDTEDNLTTEYEDLLAVDEY